jgi:hypothetical protein
VPVLVYLFTTLTAAIRLRRSPEILSDPVFWSAVSLIYVGPFIVLGSRQFGISPTVAGIGCLAAGAVTLILIIRTLSKGDRGVPRATGTRIALSAIGVSLFFGSVISGTIGTSFYRDLPTYYALIITGILIGHPALVRRFLVGAVWAIVATCVGSLALYVTSPDLVTTNFTSISSPLLHAGRLTGPFGHPNAIGSLSAIGAALSITLFTGKSRYAAYGVCLATVFLSDQRSALIAALICGLLHVLRPPRHTALTWLRTNLIALGITALLLTDVIYENFNEILNRREASVESRQQVYDYVFSQLGQILPFGIGVNGLYDRTHGILSEDGFSHAHNAWLSFLVAGGVLGGICFALLTVHAVLRCVQPKNLWYLPACVTVAVLCLAESPTYAGSNWTIISVATVSVIVLLAPLALAIAPHSSTSRNSPDEATTKLGEVSK